MQKFNVKIVMLLLSIGLVADVQAMKRGRGDDGAPGDAKRANTAAAVAVGDGKAEKKGSGLELSPDDAKKVAALAEVMGGMSAEARRALMNSLVASAKAERLETAHFSPPLELNEAQTAIWSALHYGGWVEKFLSGEATIGALKDMIGDESAIIKGLILTHIPKLGFRCAEWLVLLSKDDRLEVLKRLMIKAAAWLDGMGSKEAARTEFTKLPESLWTVCIRRAFLEKYQVLGRTNAEQECIDDVAINWACENCINPEKWHLTLFDSKISDLNGFLELYIIFNGVDELEYLDIYKNNLTSLPAALRLFPHLRMISAQHNRFTVFPTVAKTLPALEFINLGYNALTSLPEAEILLCTHLKKIYVYHNRSATRLTATPAVLAKISFT